MSGEGLQSTAQGLRSAPAVPPASEVPGAGALDLLTPNLRPDPRAALRDLRVRKPDRTSLEQRARQEGLRLEDDSCPDPYDDAKNPLRRAFTVLRGPNAEVVLLQIDDWIANDGANVGALSEIAYAFRGKRVCVFSKGVDAPARGLLTLLKKWREREQIEAEFIFWRYVDEAERDIHSLGSVFGFDSPAATPAPAPLGMERASMNKKPDVFISYAHIDKRWLKPLGDMLKPVQRRFPAALWSDQQIGAGDRWAKEIEQALAAAKVVLLLVSPSFLASNFIDEHELAPVLAAAKEGRKKILWILLSECLWKETAIKDYQAAHDLEKPLDQLSVAKRNAQLAKVAEELLKCLEPA